VDEKDISWREIGIVGIAGILIFIIAVFITVHTNQYTPEESIYNVSINNNSDGIWNVNITGSILKNNDYFGVMILWIDSNNRVITKELAYNQSQVVKGEVFNISRTYNLSETPSNALILYYDNPYVINDESGAHLVTEYTNRNGTWTN
jgi:hypothetical protein